MIGKLISMTRSAPNINRVARYVQGQGEHDKALYTGSMGGFISDDIDGQVIEMQHLAAVTRADAKPVHHLIFSWREHEQPTIEQYEKVVDAMVKEYGLTAMHQIIWGVHQDTSNFHMHVLVNLVDPRSERMTRVTYEHDALAHLCVTMEHLQGWSSEPGRPLEIDHTGELKINGAKLGKRKSRQNAVDGEQFSGAASAITLAQRHRLPALIKTAKSWDDVHERLAGQGWTYDRKGSGAVLTLRETDREINVKPSDVDRALSIAQLEKKLGAFQPSPDNVKVEQRMPEPVRPDLQPANLWEQFQHDRHQRTTDKAQALADLRIKHAEQRQATAALARKLLPFDAKASKAQCAIDACLRAALRAVQFEILRERHKGERLAVQQRHGVTQQYEQWLAQRDDNVSREALTAWQERRNGSLTASSYEQPAPTLPGISGLTYAQDGATINYKRGGLTVMVDSGLRVKLGKEPADADVLALLQLSKSKWPKGFDLHGDEVFIEQTVRVAVRNNLNINLTNQPGFDERIEHNRNQQMKQQKPRTPRQQLFSEECNKALALMKPDFVVCTTLNDHIKDYPSEPLGGVVGKRLGFDEIPSRKNPASMLPLIPPDGLAAIIIEDESKALRAERPWSVMISPRSTTKSYILIDDLTQEMLDKLLADGFAPAYIQSTSPSWIQVFFPIDKLDREIGNAVVRLLAKKFGTDEGATGIDREMRLAGTYNGKPTRTLDDGVQPMVTALGGTGEQCPKMNDLVLELSLGIGCESLPVQTTRKKLTDLELLGSPAPAPAPSPLSAVIWAPAERYAQRKKGAGWTSEHDFHAAVALRSAGFTKDDIQSAIYSCAPRALRKHAWVDYARRTADAAFNESGERALSRLHQDKGAMRELNMDMARVRRDARVAELRLDSSWCSAIPGDRIDGMVEHLDVQRVMIRTGARLVEIAMPPSELPYESRKIGSFVSIQVPVAGEAELLDLLVRKPSQDRGVEI